MERVQMNPATLEQKNTHPGVGPVISKVVAQDLLDRMQVGIDRYGEALTPANGRDALIDAYQEALDLAVYLRQELMERNTRKIRDMALNNMGELIPVNSTVVVYTQEQLFNGVTHILWNGRNFKLFMEKEMIGQINESETFMVY